VSAQPWDVPADLLEKPDEELFKAACSARFDCLVYFLLNVGDADSQVILLPATHDDGHRRVVIVDIGTTRKVPRLLRALADRGILPALDTPGLFPVVVATHPHTDHLGGMPEFLRAHGGAVEQFWEPGYFHPSGSYLETMIALEEQNSIGLMQPTSGTTRYIGNVKITVLTPGIGLRNRFDSYGTQINDASISLKVEFPYTHVVEESTDDETGALNRVYVRLREPWSMILGADAQTTAWAQTVVDFPELHRHHNPALYRELRAAHGRDHLRAHVFKVPHHASKHGVNLELVSRIAPQLALVSSVGGGGKYNFPHTLAMESIREAIQPSTTRGTARRPDHELGIHYTGARTRWSPRAQWRPLGSIAVVVPATRGRRLRMWRFGDAHNEEVDLTQGREVRAVRAP
jgi:beta-lactamase superfamily II metal-dependent hydrolase